MEWRLDMTRVPPQRPPVLDPQQQRVVDHREGPLLVLAGPGTGKTTTIVEAIVNRLHGSGDGQGDAEGDVDGRATDPLPADAVLALTFGRKAALELRDRVTARLGGGVVPTVATFHSFAYMLLRQTDAPDDYANPPRLMSGAEEDVRIRELLRGAVADGTVDWPDDLSGALPTLGLANEVRAVLARARELGLEGGDLTRVGLRSGRPAWAAVGQLARQEQEVMALENVMDYGELLLRAVVRANEPEVSARLRRRFRAVFVDEYQDTDPLQVALLRAIVGPQAALVAVGDPDQAIYGFRGADVRGLLRFPDTFRTAAGDPAPVVVLGRTRRFGPRIRAVASAVLGSRVPAGLEPQLIRSHRSPECAVVDDPSVTDVVTVRRYPDRGAQAAHVARELRLAHINRQVPWRELAVLVRSGSQIPVLQRALQAGGVPVVVAADEIPLRSEPAVAALLAVLTMAAHPRSATPAAVLDALTGPLVGLTASDVRRLGRALRARQHEAGYASPPSDVLLRELVLAPFLAVSPDTALPPDDPAVVTVSRFTALLGEVHAQIESGASPLDVLWVVWTGGRTPHGWPARLRSSALQGSRTADHDLDAVMALFDAAERLTGRYPGFLGVRMFVDSLADQQIPGESVADRGTRADAVRVLTAHRSKGLEWDEVWIVGAEEGVWPDLRARGSTLRAEELTRTGIGSGPRPADLLEEERRLFYVACTRARRQLHVTAIEASGDGGDRPSRFLADVLGALPAGAAEDPVGRPRQHVSLDGLVAELRRTALDPTASAVLRQAAIDRLAVLVAQQDAAGRPLVPLADPASWWGLAEPTVSTRPVRDPQQPMSLSGSGLDGILACPLKWFLEHEVHAETPRGTATSFGSVVHAIADFVAKGEVPAVLDDMDAEVDRVWSELRFEARWQSESERREARAALSRFLGYHLRHDRELVGTEVRVGTEVVVPRPDGSDEAVRLSGFIDRVERDAQGRLVAIDLKNMRRPVPAKDVPEHGQLGVYQLLLREGGTAEVGGAALVQLRVDEGKGSGDAKVQFQPALDGQAPTWVELRLGEAAEILRSEHFVATVGPACSYCAYRSTCPARVEGGQVTP